MAKPQGLKLTKRIIDQADLVRGRHYLWDCEVRGFGVQIEPTGTKTYFVRYRPKGHGRSGVRRFFKLGRHGDVTPEQARSLAKTTLGRVAAGADPAAELAAQRQLLSSEEPTFAEAVELFMREHVSPKRRANTEELYRILLETHAVPVLGRRRLKDLTRTDLSRLHLAIRSRPSSANRTLTVISSLYTFAAARGLVPEGYNPAKGIERYREQGRERYLSTEELQQLGTAMVEAETIGLPWQIDETNPNSNHVPKAWKGQRETLDPHAVAAIRLLLLTGARLREILHLRWEHVNFDRGLLHLPDSKTGKKTIVLNEAALEILGQLRTATSPERGALKGFVIKGLTDDKPRADLHRPWRAIRRRAELEDVRLHDLRHTFASFGAGAGLGLPIVGKLLGHSQPQTTARYAHLDADPQRRASNMIGKQLSDALKGANAPPDVSKK